MRNKLLFTFVGLIFPVVLLAWEGNIAITTPNTQLLLKATANNLLQTYYGPRVEGQVPELQAAALPTFGTVDMIELPALQVLHASGDLNLELMVSNYTSAPDGHATLHTITLTDKLQPVTVKIFYKAYQTIDLIETWTEIFNGEKKSIQLKRFDSGTLALPRGNVWTTHLHGNWAAEAVPTQEPLTPGLKVIRNTDGARNAHCDAPSLMLSLDGKPQENTGRTIGMTLCWSGNYELRLNTANNQRHQIYAGIDPQSSEYILDPGKTFETPHLAFAYSKEGMSGVSRIFHRWARQEGMLHSGMTTRDILLNSWEGIYFSITEERIINMIDDISGMGGELFVMDDGWFGTKYQRNSDDAALGDWEVDRKKLPNGIGALTRAAAERNIKFGIWIEPEATNTRSELFEKHPEWVMQTKGRELKLGRGGTQVMLDMSNPQVQDFVFGVVDRLLTAYPEIAYIKWDANASIQNYGSTYLPANKQQNLYVDYHLGLVKTLQRIRAKYPNVVIQDCASGGGRANYGLLPYFDEFWVSDNNDALQRIYIQWGTSYFFPSNAMAQHIGGSPYHMTHRSLPIKFRCDVAMSGRLGMELQPRDMTDEERQQCTTAISDYKKLRPLIQLGNLYRLVSPYEKQGLAALMYVDDNQSDAVLFVYKLENMMNQTLPRICLSGLDAGKTYIVVEKNLPVGKEPCALNGKKYTGATLMEVGLDIPLEGDYASRIFELKAEN